MPVGQTFFYKLHSTTFYVRFERNHHQEFRTKYVNVKTQNIDVAVKTQRPDTVETFCVNYLTTIPLELKHVAIQNIFH